MANEKAQAGKIWTTPKVERLDIDLTAVAQGNGSIADLYKAANARASR